MFKGWGGGAKIWPNNMQGKKIIERGRKKGGKGIFNTGVFTHLTLI